MGGLTYSSLEDHSKKDAKKSKCLGIMSIGRLFNISIGKLIYLNQTLAFNFHFINE